MMMWSIKGMRCFAGALLCLSGVFLFSSSGFARPSLVVDNLLADAKKHYDSEMYEDAVHLFSKVLLVQPRNAEALDYLWKMGLAGGIYGYQRTVVDHLHDLIGEITFYEQDIHALEEQNRLQDERIARLIDDRKILEDQIREQEAEKEDLIAQSERLYAVAVVRGQEIVQLQEMAEKKTEAVVRLHTDLFEMKNQQVEERKSFEERSAEMKAQMETQLAAAKGDLEQQQRINQELYEQKNRHQKSVADLERARDILKHKVFNMADDHDYETGKIAEDLRRREAELMLERGRLAVASGRLIQAEADLAKERKRTDQIEQLLQDRWYLEEMIRRKELERQALIEQGATAEAKAVLRQEEVVRLQGVVGSKIDELAKLHTDFFDVKDYWVTDRKDLTVKKHELFLAKKEMAQHQRTSEDLRHLQQMQYEQAILDLEVRRDALQEELFHVLQGHDEQERAMEQAIKEKGEEVAEQQKRLAIVAHQLAHSDALLLEERGRADQMEQLLEEKGKLEDVIRGKERERQQLIDQMAGISSTAELRREHIVRLQEITERRIDDLVNLHTELFAVKDQWALDRQDLAMAQQEVVTAHEDLEQQRKTSAEEQHLQKMQYEQAILDLQQRRDSLEQELFSTVQDRDELVGQLEQAVREKNHELARERERLAMVEHQLAQADALLLVEHDQMEHWTDEKWRLEDGIRQKEQERNRLMDQVEGAWLTADIRKEQIAHLRELTEKRIDALVSVHSDFFDVKDQWALDRKDLAAKQQELELVKNDLQRHQAVSAGERHLQKMQYEQTILDLQKRRDELEQEIFNALYGRDEQMRQVEDALRETHADLMLERSSRIAAIHQLLEQEKRLMKGWEQVDILYSQRAELLVEAEALRHAIWRLRQDLDFPYVRASAEHEGGENFVAYIKRQDVLIVELKERLAGLLDELRPLDGEESSSAEAREVILKRQVESLQEEIETREEEAAFLKEQVLSLERHIQDYQERLTVVEGLILEKEERIFLMESEIGSDVLFKEDGDR